MSGSVGIGNNSGNVGFTPSGDDQVTSSQTKGTALPRIDQGPKDQLVAVDGTTTTNVQGYVAASQLPQLVKPKDAKAIILTQTTATNTPQGKDADKISTQHGDYSGTSVQDQSQSESMHEVPEQPEREGDQQGQGDEGSGGSYQGSGGSQSGTGSFSGGDGGFNFESREEAIFQEPLSTNTNTAATTTSAFRTDLIGASISFDSSAKTSTKTTVSNTNAPKTVQAATSASVSKTPFDPPTDPTQFLQNANLQIEEMIKLQNEMVAQMPEGPEKLRFMDFLAKVQSALIEFQKLLNELQSEDSKGARDRSQAQLEVALAKIEEQRKEQERLREMSAEARSKQEKLNPISKTFGITGVITSSALIVACAPILIAAGPLGWVLLGILVLSLVANCQKLDGQEDTVMTKAMTGLQTVCDGFVREVLAKALAEAGIEMSENEMKITALAVRWAVVVSICCLVILANPAIFAFGGSTAIVDFFQSSKVISDSAKMDGQSDATAMQIEAYTCMALAVVAMVAGIAGAAVCPAGVTGPIANVMSASAKLAQTMANLLTKMLSTVIKITDRTVAILNAIIAAILKFLLNPQLWVSASTLALKGVETKISVDLHRLQARMAIVQATFEEDLELKDNLIATLKKMIQKLLEGMETITQDIASISNLLQKNKDGLSEVLTNLYG